MLFSENSQLWEVSQILGTGNRSGTASDVGVPDTASDVGVPGTANEAGVQCTRWFF